MIFRHQAAPENSWQDEQGRAAWYAPATILSESTGFPAQVRV